MPELPEVETLVRGLRRSVIGRRILAVRLGKIDFIDNPGVLARDLPGHRITAIDRYGKYFLMRLDAPNGRSALALLVHLGMTGHLAPHPAHEPLPKHTHVVMPLDDGRELRYTDPRRFGRMALLTGPALDSAFTSLGLEPLDITLPDFCARMAPRRARIKALLLDQRFLRGVGNIYADESLWRARIHPMRHACSLTRRQAVALRRAIQRVLAAAIRSGGSSISNYRDANGRPGAYQLRLRAYDREGKPCYRCGARIRRVIVAGRSSYFCPMCQRAPRS
ncbi:MAG: bifunctional DNA-formamidopyrimidine glycosylase/DNA-(apurinic or apyrimidinic site) lyase [Candidatus Acidiferrales bacterium]